MDSIIERQRSLHEELERIEQSAVDLKLIKLPTHRQQLGRNHQIKNLLDSLSKKSQILLDMYQDDSGLRKKETEAKSQDGGVTEFYNQLAGINSYYRRNPGQISESLELEYSRYSKAPESKEDREKRLKKIAKILKNKSNYDSSALTFGHSKLEKDILEKKEMVKKLEQAKDTSNYNDIEESFDALDEPEYFMTKDEESKLDSLFSGEESLEEIVELHNKLKQNTEDIKKPVEKKEIDNTKIYCEIWKKHQRAAKITANQNDSSNSFENIEPSIQTFVDLEKKATMYGNFLTETISDTIFNVERKQSLTEEERNQDAEIEDYEAQISSEEETEHIYNPLKLPLGWDGKPIPYWLYKLHGLRVEYNCEICGNFIYRGRKAYDLHFQEARHSNNMRKLGIPNTRQFHDISRIEDAVTLWGKIKQQKKQTISALDTFEEFEDTQGNVFNRKTYEDLKRQGLL
ncbi:hypothetical protein BB561_003442 [Smittium simulii]|uniref:Matrin-type domain-containing protein n=1 Tax=Smittium simulii TaxID=133385 RepID=A0A2T9YLH9_9FUNG|nr:hypothetical protein BB561_003442 [Smittium simulii]